MSKCLLLYTVFHLNLAYSSIEEEQRPEVISRCYWPLLQLVRDLKVPMGIEASAFTLEIAAAIDPEWLNELRRLIEDGICQFIGSGYAQIIGPLVPAEVNAANLRLGNEIYERLLGFRPHIALVNEQAYSAGLIQHYLDHGYTTIIMEWDNPSSYHPEWVKEWRYLPQIACGHHEEEISLLWNNSIAFQKFQRFTHGDMDLHEYLSYLASHLSEYTRALVLYGNDVEVFDFRPGRYHTEATLHEDGEWKRIQLLFENIIKDNRFQLVTPSKVVDLINTPGAGNKLHLESPEQPIPVKKQGKYNITRWAVTGRDDIGINTACWRIFDAIKHNYTKYTDDDWRQLCYLWSSDFRTHITEKRWDKYCHELKSFQMSTDNLIAPLIEENTTELKNDSVQIEKDGRYLIIQTNSVRVLLNCAKGLAIERLWFKTFDGPPLCGTLHHGYYEDIILGSDWYTGHIVVESLGQPKITDLVPVEPTITKRHQSGDIEIKVELNTSLGKINKKIIISSSEPKLTLGYLLQWKSVPLGPVRLGNITINPNAFDRSTLYYSTSNGGKAEIFPLIKRTFDHGNAVSFQVSANSGIGITSNLVELGDANHGLRIFIDQTAATLLGQINYREIGESFFCRLAFSGGEIDETCRWNSQNVRIIEPKIIIMPR